MERFHFYLDKKVTAWYREHHTVFADKYEDAYDIIKDNFIAGHLDKTFEYQELMYDSIEDLPVEENHGYATLELYDDNDEPIIDNGINEQI